MVSAKPSLMKQGENGVDDHDVPQQKVRAVACGGWHTAVIGEKGGVWTCGRGEYGRLGLGDQTSQVRQPFVCRVAPILAVPMPEHWQGQAVASLVQALLTFSGACVLGVCFTHVGEIRSA